MLFALPRAGTAASRAKARRMDKSNIASTVLTWSRLSTLYRNTAEGGRGVYEWTSYANCRAVARCRTVAVCLGTISTQNIRVLTLVQYRAEYGVRGDELMALRVRGDERVPRGSRGSRGSACGELC